MVHVETREQEGRVTITPIFSTHPGKAAARDEQDAEPMRALETAVGVDAPQPVGGSSLTREEIGTFANPEILGEPSKRPAFVLAEPPEATPRVEAPPQFMRNRSPTPPLGDGDHQYPDPRAASGFSESAYEPRQSAPGRAPYPPRDFGGGSVPPREGGGAYGYGMSQSAPAPPPPPAFDARIEKIRLLAQLQMYKARGKVVKSMTMQDDLEEIMLEAERVSMESDLNDATSTMRRLVTICLFGTEKLVERFNLPIHLQGFTQHTVGEMHNYDPLFAELHTKHGFKLPAEVRLLLALGGSALMYHMFRDPSGAKGLVADAVQAVSAASAPNPPNPTPLQNGAAPLFPAGIATDPVPIQRDGSSSLMGNGFGMRTGGFPAASSIAPPQGSHLEFEEIRPSSFREDEEDRADLESLVKHRVGESVQGISSSQQTQQEPQKEVRFTLDPPPQPPSPTSPKRKQREDEEQGRRKRSRVSEPGVTLRI
jgi:hypothetical protein